MNDVAAKLALPARWLMVAAIAYTLATSALFFLSPPQSAPIGTAPGRVDTRVRPPVDINAILTSNIFGTADPAAVNTVSDSPAVVTQLPLELLGVFVADVADDSAAIIAQRGRQGILYAVGDDLPGSATLVEVHSDHVVLRRAGARESLHFPAPGQGLAARTPVSAPMFNEEPVYDEAYEEVYEEPYDQGSVDVEPANPGELLDEYRDRLEEDPSQALDELGVSAVTEGAAEGYRIGDLAQSPYLSQTGLQPGDVILSVNGRPVGDLNQDRLELENVLAQGSARLEVQRGTRRFFVTASLQ